jgi:LmbE family N-acetylglucosaminyl deacetylase
MARTTKEKKTMLVVLAHPDDESFGMGGTIAYYASKGVAVHLLCATRGEAGTVEPQFLKKHKTIAKLREAELSCAAKALGLATVTYLGYRDSGMAGSADNRNRSSLFRAPVDKVAEKIVRHIRRLRPQVVVTFDPVGGYHHPDHIAIHNATVKAFNLTKAANPGSKLYYTALNRRRLRWIVRIMRLSRKDPTQVGRNKDIDLTKLTRDKDTPAHVTINYRSVRARKERADACHASQLEGRFTRVTLMDIYWRIVGRTDTFTRLVPLTPDSYHSTDLFAG